MIHTTRIFSRFSKEKFKNAKFKTKLHLIWRIIWALFKIIILLPPLVIIAWLSFAVYKLVDIIADKVCNDSIMTLIYEGLTSEPSEVKMRYEPDNLVTRREQSDG
jgi:hypothetical protein